MGLVSKQEKTAVVVDVEQNKRRYPKNGQTMYVHVITMSNGDTGDYRILSPTCDYFQKGETVQYVLKIWGNTDGSKDYVLEKPVEKNNDKPFNRGKSSRNDSAIAAQHAVGRSVDLVCAGKIDLKELFVMAEKILTWTSSKGEQKNNN